MSWESHRGRPRYTRSFRRHGRIVRQYVGSGPIAEFVARSDRLARAARERQRQAAKEERTRWEQTRATTRALEQLTDLLVTAALMADGYHRHDRGAWRKRRIYEQEDSQRRTG
jgi:hypothetical protein